MLNSLKWIVPSVLHLVLHTSHRKRLQQHLKLFQLIEAKRPELPAATATPNPMQFQWPVLLKSAPLWVVYSSNWFCYLEDIKYISNCGISFKLDPGKGCGFVHTPVHKMLFHWNLSINTLKILGFFFSSAVPAVRLIRFRWLKGSKTVSTLHLILSLCLLVQIQITNAGKQ